MISLGDSLHSPKELNLLKGGKEGMPFVLIYLIQSRFLLTKKAKSLEYQIFCVNLHIETKIIT